MYLVRHRRFCSGFLVGVVGAVLLAAASVPIVSAAQNSTAREVETVQVPNDLRAEEVGDFVARLNDAESRLLLMDYLRQDTTAGTGTDEAGLTGLLRRFNESSIRLGEARQAMLEALSNAGTHFAVVLRNLTDNGGWPVLLKGIVILLAMLALGTMAEWAVGKRLLWAEPDARSTTAPSARARLAVVVMATSADLAGVLLFAFTSWLASLVFFDRFDPMRVFTLAVLATITVTRVVYVLARALLAPGRPELRLIEAPEPWARQLQHWLVAVFGVGALAYFGCALLKLLGLQDYLHRLLLILSDTIITGMLVYMVWRSRFAVADYLATTWAKGRGPFWEYGGGQSSASASEPISDVPAWHHYLGRSWHLLATVYLVVLWWFHTRDVALRSLEASNAAILSLLLLLAIPVVDGVLKTLLDAVQEASAARGLVLRARYGRTIRMVIRIAMLVWVLSAAAEAAGFALIGVVASPLGQRVGDALLDIGAAVIVAYVVWEFVRSAIDRHMPAEEGGGLVMGEEGGAGQATRAATLLPLLRSFILVVLVTMVTLITLSSLGVNIGPLLAGAGVVGLAVGFGSQKLVQDIVAGIFFLVDDAFRIGEYIEAGGMKGTVESISIRSMRLRHHLGAVQTLPYGEIQAVKNHSRDWATMKLEIRLPYDVDIEKVRKIIKKTGQKMLEHPEYGHHFLQPLKSQGVFRVEDSALIVRMKFTTVPNEQWVIRREAYRLVQEALEAAGIKYAHRQVVVTVPQQESSSPATAPAAGAAAGSAILEADQDAKSPPDSGEAR